MSLDRSSFDRSPFGRSSFDRKRCSFDRSPFDRSSIDRSSFDRKGVQLSLQEFHIPTVFNFIHRGDLLFHLWILFYDPFLSEIENLTWCVESMFYTCTPLGGLQGPIDSLHLHHQLHMRDQNTRNSMSAIATPLPVLKTAVNDINRNRKEHRVRKWKRVLLFQKRGIFVFENATFLQNTYKIYL